MLYVCTLIAGHVMFGTTSQLVNIDEIIQINQQRHSVNVYTSGAKAVFSNTKPSEFFTELNACYKEHNIE